MLNSTRQKFDQIKNNLLKQEKEVEAELKEAEQDDPLTHDGLAESNEPGTSSWMEDVHSRSVAVRDNLGQMLTKIQTALLHINKGDYGKCEKCGKAIEPARLEAMPTAGLCIACSKAK